MGETDEMRPPEEAMNEHKILPIGTVLGVDDDGYLISQSGPERIVAPWDGPVTAIREAYTARLGDKLQSLYIRGSVGRGNAIEGVSDIDGLAVVYGDPREIDWSWTKQFDAETADRYPFLTGVDISTQSYEGILGGGKKIAAFLIKTNSACIHGEDLAPKLPKVKPGRDAVIACWDLERKVSPDYMVDKTEVTTAQKARWSAKQILRAGFELVMEDEQAYTRDLYPSYELFSKHFPDREPVMRRALEMALWPTNDEQTFQQLLTDIGPWLVERVNEKYPRKN